MSQFLLSMENISKVYDNGIVANDDVSFNLKAGEIHALVGENGAGKSTLMKILFGMEKPTNGRIVLNGKPCSFSSSKDAIELGIGMVHQHFMLVDSFTVAQNILLDMEPRKGLFVDQERSIRITEELSQKYNLSVDARARVSELSVGMKQKIEILKTLIRGAKIIILDEPTAVLTPQETEQLFEELKNLKKHGHTIIFISHKIREVKAISDSITIMRQGKRVGEYRTADLSGQQISNFIVGRDIVTNFEKPAISPGKPLLVVKGLAYYGESGVPLVKDVSFSVPGGRIVGIAGVEGNGQAQLARLLSRGLAPQAGAIFMEGKDICTLSSAQLRRRSFGYIPEDRIDVGSAKEGSILENLISNKYAKEPFCKHGLLQRPALESASRQAVEEYGIKCFSPSQKLAMLSGGNMQKVVVARECFGGPHVLIAEQPTRGVDIGAAQVIHRKLLQMRMDGCAILLISADLNEVMELSDSLLVMYGGEIVAYFRDASKVQEHELGLYMLGVERHDEKRIKEALYE